MSDQHSKKTAAAESIDTMAGFLAAVASKSIVGIYMPSAQLVEAVLSQMGVDRFAQVCQQTDLDDSFYYHYRNALPSDDILAFYRNNKDQAYSYMEELCACRGESSTIELIYNDLDKSYFKNMSIGLVVSSLCTPKHDHDSKLDKQFLSDSAYLATTHIISTTCIVMTAHAYAAYIRQQADKTSTPVPDHRKYSYE